MVDVKRKADEGLVACGSSQPQNTPLPNKLDQTSNLEHKHKGKSKIARKVPAIVAVAPFSPSCSVILEEAMDVPVFWDGENSKPLIKWGPFLDKEGNKQTPPFFRTIHDFLSFYVAGKYLNKCSMSLQVTSTKYITDLKLSDPFSKITDYHNKSKDGRPVTLLLSHAYAEESEGGYAKFTLYIRELQARKVLWNGSILTNRLVAKLNQSDMGLTIENCLQNYVAKGYLSENCQVQLVKEQGDTIPSNREELITISTGDLVNTLFKGNSATIVIRKTCSKDNESRQQFTERDCEEMSPASSTKIPVFNSPPAESTWVGKSWGEISENVRELLSSVEITLRDMILPVDIYAGGICYNLLLEKKRLLETAMRRRTRVVDEVWRCFLSLRNVHRDLINGNIPQIQNSLISVQRSQAGGQSVVAARTGGDLDHSMQMQGTCLDFLPSGLLQYGLELELYEEDSPGLSRIAGVGVGIAVAIAICTIVYYY